MKLKNVLSCLNYGKGNFCFILSSGRLASLRCVCHVATVNQLQYFELELLEQLHEPNSEDVVESHCLLLPLLTKTGLPNAEAGDMTGYTIIDSEWKIIDRAGIHMIEMLYE